MRSKRTLASPSRVSQSALRAIGITAGSLTVAPMIFFQSLSTTWKFCPSSGICLRMSALLKIGSRYIHVDWHFSQLSSMSCSWNSVFCHSLARSANGFTNGDAFMDCTLTIWSSKIIWISSVPPTTLVPVSLYGMHLNVMPSHSASIFSSVFRREYSFEAAAPMFLICSILSSTPICSRSWMENSAPSSSSCPTMLNICPQWRSVSAGLPSSCSSS
mmetsp:Transcript_38446/g.64595  ORF Transcript_38446/g.64595 Transcript_38446/m.64595 type:complete len:216 (+) Transcript_38446:229-876(+)